MKKNGGREGREGRSQAGPKGRQLEVGPRRGPRLLVGIYIPIVQRYGNGEEGNVQGNGVPEETSCHRQRPTLLDLDAGSSLAPH